MCNGQPITANSLHFLRVNAQMLYLDKQKTEANLQNVSTNCGGQDNSSETKYFMTKVIILILTSILLTFDGHSQMTTIYVIDNDGKKDSCLMRVLSKHKIVFENYGLQIMVGENYETIDSLFKVDKKWFKKLDKELSNCSTWKTIKLQNSQQLKISKPDIYFEVQFWDFALIKKYKYFTAPSNAPVKNPEQSVEVVGGEGEINRDGSYKHPK